MVALPFPVLVLLLRGFRRLIPSFLFFYICLKFKNVCFLFQDVTFVLLLQLEIITETSVSQKVEYLCTSTALTNVTVTTTVLKSLAGQDGVTSANEVVTFLDDFNVAYKQVRVHARHRSAIILRNFVVWLTYNNWAGKEGTARIGV